MGEKFQRFLIAEVYALAGASEGEYRTLDEWEPHFAAAEENILADVHRLAPDVMTSVRWSLKYGRKRRSRELTHNRRAILKRLGFGFRKFQDSVVVAENLNKDLHWDFVQWVSANEDSYASVTGISDVLGGSTLRSLVLLGIHARGCTIASEVLHLSEQGFLEGAYARTRSLYELVTIASLLSIRDESPFELTERYHLSAMVERRKEVRLTGEQDPFDDVPELEDAIREKWGADFFKPYGWAIPAINDGRSRQVTFRDIEFSLGLEPLRHAYVAMNHAVHAGAMAITTRFDSRIPFRNRTGGEVDYYSAAWVARTAVFFFSMLQRATVRQIADIVGSDEDLQMGPLVGLCDSAEDFFRDYTKLNSPGKK